MNKVVGVVLAAGKGVRMKSAFPKMLHYLCGRPLINYPIETLRRIGIDKIFVVVGYKKETLLPYLKEVKIIVQKRLLGTGHALLATKPYLKNFKRTILVISGDVPLVREATLQKLVKQHQSLNSAVTILVANIQEPRGYGRILRDKNSKVIKICEETDLEKGLSGIKEVNSGIYCFKSSLLFRYLKKIKPNPRKKEYYLTDIIGLMAGEGEKISTLCIDDSEEILGINTREDLSRAGKVLNKRMVKKLMDKGVTIVDPLNTYIGEGVEIGKDTIIFPFTVIEPGVSIGRNCRIGPFCHLREKTVIGDNVELGNFVELVRTRMDSFSKAKHLTYLGDACVGKDVNIGAGTIVANFDGKKKNKTIIYDKAFIGSGTILISPVKVGKGAVTGAGTVVTRNKDVPPGETVVGVPAKILTKE
ncbi:MAG: sugar phosphate nucleotidyltransferase [Candidatus Omnitrophica bacterium]|nr:sugar phosphate nucleotidyltransferase [Candidatus Omnitrophota bacterium]